MKRSYISEKSLLFYDSACGCCRRFKTIIEFFDACHKIRFVSLSNEKETPKLAEMSEEKLHSSFHYFDSSGATTSGGKAMANLMEEMLRPVLEPGMMQNSRLMMSVLSFFYNKLSRLHASCSTGSSPRDATD